MENASKALIIAASVLIAVMLLSFMVYVFKSFSATARNTDKRYSAQEIEKFNSKFVGYETGGTYSVNDEAITITSYRGRTATSQPTRDTYSYAKIFSKTGISGEKYRKALVSVSNTLNTGYDVVTAINDAIDVNYQNNNAYKYDYLEIESSVEVIVDLGNTTKGAFNFNDESAHYQFLMIEANGNVKPKCVYGTNTVPNDNDKMANVSSFSTAHPISVYDMLDELRATEVIQVEGKSYTVYQYYFFGEVKFNNKTGLVETVKFTLAKDNKFGDNSIAERYE